MTFSGKPSAWRKSTTFTMCPPQIPRALVELNSGHYSKKLATTQLQMTMAVLFF